MDTGGIEKFKPIYNIYYQKADCFLLVYDITNKKSYKDCINFFIDKIKENSYKKYKILLLGNKIDLLSKRQVSNERASIFASENNYEFLESSCETHTNVSNAFLTLIDMTIIKTDKNKDKKKDDEESKTTEEENENIIDEKYTKFPKLKKYLNY